MGQTLTPPSSNAAVELNATAVYGCLSCKDYPTTFVTQTIRTVLGYSQEQFMQDPEFRINLVHPEDGPRVRAALSRVTLSGCQVEEYRVKRRDRRYTWVRDEMRLASPSSEAPAHIVGSMTELSHPGSPLPNISGEALAAEYGGPFEVLAESSSMMIWSSNLSGGLEYVSKGWLAFSGHVPEQEHGEGWLELVHPEDRGPCVTAFGEAAKAGTTFELEFRLLRYDGRYRWVVIRGVPRFHGRNGLYIGHIGYCIDITNYRNQSDELRASLLEKEVLIKEVHHRVKNNLQVVCSILSLQAASASEPWTLQLFREAEQRVMSIALIHEQLYMSENLALLDLGSYLRRVTNHLLQCYRRELGDVKIQVDSDSILLPIDIAQPCGLIVHELVSNSLKYAFPDRRAGEILVKTCHGANNVVLLTVADTGVGLPEKFDIEKTETLGLQIVGALTKQLGGSFKLSTKPITAIDISFTVKEPPQKGE
ncbi:MAG: PAS domain-containing protein [Bryobacteraceae bacterium]|jgi:PAS domain S-box-containing protein